MKRSILLDTGPLVAFLNRTDHHHAWVLETMRSLPSQLVTCEPVLAEACHLVRGLAGGEAAILELVGRGRLAVPFHLAEQVDAVRRLMGRYANVPMSLADACLVRMSETLPGARVFTLDSDFRIYRRNGRETIPTLMPDRHPS